MSGKAMTVRMKDDVAELVLYDVIGEDFFGGVSAATFRRQVKEIKAKTLNLRLNSPGGDVFEAAAMLQALDEFKGQVEVDVDGLAASAASFLAMGGKTVRVASNAMIMIHNPHAFVVGESGDMRHMAELLDKVKGQILDTYLRRSTLHRDDLSAAMDAETWYTGQEAVEAGLADEATAPVPVAALAGHKEILAKLGCKKVPQVKLDGPEWAETRRRAAIAARL